LPGFDHARDVAVLDRMVRTLSISTGPPTEDAVVAAYQVGDFSVTAVPGADAQVCLRVAPDGPPSCLAPPVPAGVTTPLALPDGRQVVAGLAGQEVYRVVAQRPGDAPFAVVPAPVPGTDLGGFAFVDGPAEIGALSWYGLYGARLWPPD
jgi:hypothetical protein